MPSRIWFAHPALVAFVSIALMGCPSDPIQGAGEGTPDVDGQGIDVVVVNEDSGSTDTPPPPPPPCANGTACQDGDQCTQNDVCIDGQCQGTPFTCDDGLECTFDRCNGKGGCNSELQAGLWCLIAGTCYADGSANPANGCEACVTPVSAVTWSASDGTPCDDGLECTAADECANGGCAGTKEACDDDNPCTTNGCKEGQGCIHAAVQGPCEDGDLCTLGDTCTNQVCIPGPKTLDCADGDPCTLDNCTADGGCDHNPHSGPCEDGNPCTAGDSCIQGECISGSTIVSCDDENACTDDVCLAGSGCAHIPNLAPCEDGNVCSTGDTCSSGVCSPGFFVLECDDDEPCTQDICEPFKGCNHIPTFGACDDGNPCTEGDSCAAGICKGTKATECDDGNPCTDDVCDAKFAGGCHYPNNTAACDDGDPCTVGDVCSKGSCKATAANCDDGNPCTVGTCEGEGGCVFEVSSAPGCNIDVQITSPPRAVTLTGSTKITVKGKVTSPIAPLDVLTINGKVVKPKSNGTFTTTLSAEHGLNIIEALASDMMGNSDKAVRSFQYSTKYLPMSSSNPEASKMTKGIYVYLGPEAIDDGNHALSDADDLATIFEIIISAFDIGALLPNPLVNNGDYKVTIKNVSLQPAKVKLTPIPSGLNLWVSIKALKANVDADGKCTFCPSASGKITIQEILIISDVDIKASGGKVEATLKNTDVILINPDVDVDGILGSIFDFLIDFIVDQFAPTIENAFKSELGKVIPDTLEDALGSLAFDTTFDVPALLPGAKAVTVKLKTGLETTFWTDDGGTLRMWAAATTKKKISHGGLGTLRRNGCLSGSNESLAMTMEDPLQFGLGDDVLNQILYSLWWGGGLQFPVPPSLLGGVDLTEFGVEDLKLTVDFLLPPVVTSCNVYKDLQLQFGDVKVHVTGKLFGQALELDLYASAKSYVELQADSKGLGLAVTDFAQIATDVVVLTPGLQSAEKLIDEKVGQDLVPLLFDQLGGGSLAGFPIPEIDLGGLADGIPEGTAIAIDPKKVFRKLGWTIVSGKIK